MTVAEVMVSVTGLDFAYAQAPKTMKAVVQSFWLLTTCFGNIIDIFLVAAKMGSNQASKFRSLAQFLYCVGYHGETELSSAGVEFKPSP